LPVGRLVLFAHVRPIAHEMTNEQYLWRHGERCTHCQSAWRDDRSPQRKK
jgi:hypothetical protein